MGHGNIVVVMGSMWLLRGRHPALFLLLHKLPYMAFTEQIHAPVWIDVNVLGGGGGGVSSGTRGVKMFLFPEGGLNPYV